MQKAKDGGLDVVQTYVFWNGHEPTPGNVLSFLLLFFFSLFAKCFSGTGSAGFVIFSNEYLLHWLNFQYNFEGRYDLVRFVKTVQKAGMYVHLRIGPYICGEWNFG